MTTYEIPAQPEGPLWVLDQCSGRVDRWVYRDDDRALGWFRERDGALLVWPELVKRRPADNPGEVAAQPPNRREKTIAINRPDISVPVTPPVARVCACDKPDQRCTVHGWVLRAGSAR